MNYREIPEAADEIQPGLWAIPKTTSLGGLVLTTYELYSAEGYCFYIPANNMDENGDLLPENQRTYYIYANSGYRTIDQVNAAIVSVPYAPGYEIASTGGNGNHEVM